MPHSSLRLPLTLLALSAPMFVRAESAPEKAAPAPQLDDAKREKIAVALDKAAAELKESSGALREIADINDKLADIRTKQASALRAKDKELGETLQKEAAELRQKRRALMEKLRKDAGEVRETFENATGGARRGKAGAPGHTAHHGTPADEPKSAR